MDRCRQARIHGIMPSRRGLTSRSREIYFAAPADVSMLTWHWSSRCVNVATEDDMALVAVAS